MAASCPVRERFLLIIEFAVNLAAHRPFHYASVKSEFR